MPDLLQVDALPLGTAWSDASAGARPDVAADAVDLLQQRLAGVVGKWAGRAQDARARDDSPRRWEHQAGRVGAQGVKELCTQAADQFAERSCAAPAEPEQPAAPLLLEPLAVRTQKPTETQPQEERVLREEALPTAPAKQRPERLAPAERRRDAQERGARLEPHLPRLLEAP